jgi:hypothetical protein
MMEAAMEAGGLRVKEKATENINHRSPNSKG